MSGRWFRDVYRDAVWESEELTAQEKAVAETYARHARDEHDDKSATADLAWTTYPRLMAKAGIGRRANVSTAVASLVEKGWLTVVREVSRRPTLYRLTIPAGSSTPGTTEMEGASSTTGTTVVPPSPSGSSTSAAGSSDGGTQPLGPLENQPSTSSLSARTSLPAPRDPADDRERDDSTTSEDQTPTPTTAAGKMLAKHGVYGLEADQAESFIRRTVEHPIQGDGWWYAADSNGSLNTWIQRWRDSPAQQPAQPDDTRMCPLHTRFPMFNCNVCWADVIGGDDPYTGREDERPPGWREAYNRQKRSSERGRIAPSIRSEPGSHTEEWARRRAAEAEKATRGHEPYSNPPPEAYADWLTGQPEQSAIEGNRTPRGGQLGRIFASREADYDEKL